MRVFTCRRAFLLNNGLRRTDGLAVLRILSFCLFVIKLRLQSTKVLDKVCIRVSQIDGSVDVLAAEILR